MDCMSMHQGGSTDQCVNPKKISVKMYVQSSPDIALIQTTRGVTNLEAFAVLMEELLGANELEMGSPHISLGVFVAIPCEC